MKTLVVFYSLSGNTRKVADILASRLGADVEEIKEKKDRSGKFHILFGCIDALLKRKTVISELKHDPASYDLVVVGTPVWAAHMAPAVRTYLSRFAGKFRKAAFFSTRKGGEDKPVKILHFDDMAKVAGVDARGLLDVKLADIDSGIIERKVSKFADDIGK